MLLQWRRRKPRPERTIRSLLTALIATVLLPLLLVVALLIGQQTADLSRQTDELALATAERVANSLERELQALRATLQALATSPALTRGDLAQFYAQATAVARLVDAAIVLRDLDGQHLVNTRVRWGDPLPKRYVAEIDDRIRQLQSPTLSDLFVGTVAAREIVVVAAPVFIDATLKYTLNVSIEPQRLSRVLNDQKLDGGWVAAVVDRNGRIVARSEDLDRYLGKASNWSVPPSDVAGTHRTDRLDGTRVLRGFKRTSDGWVVSAFVPTELIDAPLREMWAMFLLIGLGSIGTAVLLALYLGRSIAEPIRTLEERAATLGRGEVVPHLNSGIREVNSVSSILNTASIGLRDTIRELAESEAKFRAVFEQAAVGFEQLDLDGRWMNVNERLCQMLGYTREECLALTSDAITHPGDRMLEMPLIEQLLRGEIPVYSLEKRYMTKGGDVVWVQASSSLARGRDGSPRYRISVIEDVTDRRRARAEAARLAAVVLSSDAAIISMSLDGAIETWNPGATKVFGYQAEEITGKSVEVLVPPHLRAETAEHLERVRQGDSIHLETQALHKEGGERDVAINLTPIRSRHGAIVAISYMAEDIHERIEWQRSIALLNRELQHRVKNSLAVIQSIANQTIRSIASHDEFRVAFQGRLQSLAAANDLLTQSNWTGADLETFISRQLTPLMSKPEVQLSMSGPPARIPSSLTVPLGLALHELGTNALKFGALTGSGGSVHVSWLVTRNGSGKPLLELSWQERGGPPVAPPTRRGFGTTLIEHGIPGAVVQRKFNREGVSCSIVVPLPAEDVQGDY